MGYKGDYVKTNYSRTYLGLLLIFIWLEFTQLARCLIGIQILTNVQHYVHRDHHPLDRHRCTYDKHYIKLDNGRLPKMIWKRTRTYNRYTQGRTSHLFYGIIYVFIGWQPLFCICTTSGVHVARVSQEDAYYQHFQFTISWYLYANVCVYVYCVFNCRLKSEPFETLMIIKYGHM